MKTDRDTLNYISSILTEAIENLAQNYRGDSLTDIHLFVDSNSGELSVYDDEENLITQSTVESWLEIDDHDDINRHLRIALEKLNDENKFEALDIYKPFSVNLVDEDFIVQEELLLIEDDSTIRLENDFLERMEREFDEFLEKLLKD